MRAGHIGFDLRMSQFLVSGRSAVRFRSPALAFRTVILTACLPRARWLSSLARKINGPHHAAQDRLEALSQFATPVRAYEDMHIAAKSDHDVAALPFPIWSHPQDTARQLLHRAINTSCHAAAGAGFAGEYRRGVSSTPAHQRSTRGRRVAVAVTRLFPGELHSPADHFGGMQPDDRPGRLTVRSRCRCESLRPAADQHAPGPPWWQHVIDHHGRGGQRSPHPGRVHLGYPDGRCRRAAPSLLSREMFSTVVRCRYQCSAATALSGAVTSRLVRMNE